MAALSVRIHLAEYDPRWNSDYSQLAHRVQTALADRIIALEHVGSTSVPGLAAKPVIDMLLTVRDSREETTYVPGLSKQGFTLKIREPDWFEHRVLKSSDIEANLHVFSAGCEEIDRMLMFRDRLRTHEADRERYEQAKRELATREWSSVQEYADAKTDIVRSILACSSFSSRKA